MSGIHPAYIAGFYDGEGSTWQGKLNGYEYWKLTFAQNDRRPLDAILQTFPGGIIVPIRNKYNGSHQLIYNGHKGTEIGEAMLPFLIVKYDEVEAFLRWAKGS